MIIKFRKNIKFFIFSLISICIFLILYKINLLDFGVLIKLVIKEPYLILLSAILYISTILIGSYRYFLILKSFNYNLNYNNSLKITSSSIFYGQWFPGSSALIEFFRIFFLKQHININIKESFLSVFYDRVIGLVSFIIICFISISLKYELFKSFSYFFFIVFLFGIILVNKIPPLIFKILKINFIPNNFFLISYEMILSLVISSLIILTYFLISKISNVNLNLIDIAIMMPIIAILTIIPLGIGNLGGLQLGTLFIFQFISEKSFEIITMSLIFAIITLIINSIFGAIFLKSSLITFKKAITHYEKK